MPEVRIRRVESTRDNSLSFPLMVSSFVISLECNPVLFKVVEG